MPGDVYFRVISPFEFCRINFVDFGFWILEIAKRHFYAGLADIKFIKNLTFMSRLTQVF